MAGCRPSHRCSLAIQQRMIWAGARLRLLRAGERFCASMVDEAKPTDGEAVSRMGGASGASPVPSWVVNGTRSQQIPDWRDAMAWRRAETLALRNARSAVEIGRILSGE